MAWAAFNGAGLAFVLPCAQSILADYYIPEQRGRAFGFMFTLAALGEPRGSPDMPCYPCSCVWRQLWLVLRLWLLHILLQAVQA